MSAKDKKSVKQASAESNKWFKDLLTQAKPSKKARIIQGSMYAFSYDPKHKDTLSVYDVNPLIIVLEKYDDGFLGINLHYLPKKVRLVLLRNIMVFNYKYLKKGLPAKINYRILKSANVYRYGMVCIKRYLYSHLRVAPIRVSIKDWPKAVMLETEKFRKMTETEVWKQSLNMLRNRGKKQNKKTKKVKKKK